VMSGGHDSEDRDDGQHVTGSFNRTCEAGREKG